jgi:hypothetical protein
MPVMAYSVVGMGAGRVAWIAVLNGSLYLLLMIDDFWWNSNVLSKGK